MKDKLYGHGLQTRASQTAYGLLARAGHGLQTRASHTAYGILARAGGVVAVSAASMICHERIGKKQKKSNMLIHKK